MKFDPKKPHGVITNHDWARYEQDGILFDSLGLPRGEIDVAEEEQPVEIEPVTTEKDFELDNARDFLANILANGALPRSVVFKECSSNNQSWEKVQTAFAKMGGEARNRKTVLYWKLKAE